jgi:hypothetical protein
MSYSILPLTSLKTETFVINGAKPVPLGTKKRPVISRPHRVVLIFRLLKSWSAVELLNTKLFQPGFHAPTPDFSHPPAGPPSFRNVDFFNKLLENVCAISCSGKWWDKNFSCFFTADSNHSTL